MGVSWMDLDYCMKSREILKASGCFSRVRPSLSSWFAPWCVKNCIVPYCAVLGHFSTKIYEPTNPVQRIPFLHNNRRYEGAISPLLQYNILGQIVSCFDHSHSFVNQIHIFSLGLKLWTISNYLYPIFAITIVVSVTNPQLHCNHLLALQVL